MKITIILFALFVTINATAQLDVKAKPNRTTIGDAGGRTNYVAQLICSVIDDDTTYTVVYQNIKYKTISDIQSFSFSNDGNTVDKFYSLLKTFFTDENKKNKDYTLDINLGDSPVSLYNFRSMGTTGVMIFLKDGHFMLSEKQVDKLFGKL